MSGITDLETLLKTMSPKLRDGEFIFGSVFGSLSDYLYLDPLGSFLEEEGLTLILSTQAAERGEIAYEGTFRQISLQVHSSLEAVGLTAAISAKLGDLGISANVVAGYYHDHVFVPSAKAEQAVEALAALGE